MSAAVDFNPSIDEARRVYNFGIDYKSFISPPSISGKSRHGDLMKYTRFEKARIIGARALQISLGAPVLINVPEDVIDPIQIAMLEFEKGVIPITVKRDT